MIETLKQLRHTQPFNFLATSGIKLISNYTGLELYSLKRVLHRTGKIKVTLPPYQSRQKSFTLIGKKDEGYSSQAYWRGWDTIESETLSVWYHLSLNARTILDIGSYIGHMSLVSAVGNDKAKVHAFEPLPMAYTRLTQHKELNHTTNLYCHNIACSNTNSTLPFYFSEGQLSPSNSLSKSFMEESERNGYAKNLTKIDVQVVRVDDWAKQNNVTDIDLVKIDTETTEPLVLEGMLHTIEQYKPDMIIECLPGASTLAEINKILSPFGYKHYPLVSRTPRQKHINKILNRIANRAEDDIRTHNILFSARNYNVEKMFKSADDLSESN